MRGRTTLVAWAMGALSVALALGAVVPAGRNGRACRSWSSATTRSAS